nr:PREDICTED: vacuolar protein sorting-associated protein VTA1 homolog [Latimeria chalumnae]|eukprot:XP_006008177.2 PREDICTED: vacuolar protein sorting-associated protein VTA1 homolog [Latimeria chalumnae]
MKLDSKSPECRKFLSKLMDQLETMKKQLSDNDSITQEVVGNAHVENYALKMFLYADNEDRAGRFHKNMIKSFYTASLLIDVLAVFGELSEEKRKEKRALQLLFHPSRLLPDMTLVLCQPQITLEHRFHLGHMLLPTLQQKYLITQECPATLQFSQHHRVSPQWIHLCTMQILRGRSA